MTGYFSDREVIHTPEGFKAMVACIKAGITFSADVIEELVEKHYDLIADEGYADFEDSGRWSISKYYIFNFDGDYYRIWEDVRLTEMQENYWYDQTFEKVSPRRVMRNEWMTNDEYESYERSQNND